jgi:hypothetical protein
MIHTEGVNDEDNLARARLIDFGIPENLLEGLDGAGCLRSGYAWHARKLRGDDGGRA